MRLSLNMSFIVLAVLILPLLTGCGGSSTARFCEVVTTADAQMDPEEVNDYYERLEAAAPDEIKNDVTTLRDGWQRVSFSLGGRGGRGEINNISRPPEVSAAAESLANFIVEQCGVELGKGIYLAIPDAGW